MNIPLGQYSGSDATKALEKTVQKHHQETSRQTKIMIRLMWAILIIASVTLVVVILKP